MDRAWPPRRQPPYPPVICWRPHQWVQPPLWIDIFPISANEWDQVTGERNVTLQIGLANPAMPPAQPIQIETDNSPPHQATTRLNNTTTTWIIRQRIQATVIILEYTTAGVVRATTLSKPPMHSF